MVVGFELPQMVDVVAMASTMVVVAYVGAMAFALVSTSTDLMSATSNGVDFEHFLVTLKMGQ